jgi:hypothetical protein
MPTAAGTPTGRPFFWLAVISHRTQQNRRSFRLIAQAQLMLDNCWLRIYTHSQSLQAALNFGVVS